MQNYLQLKGSVSASLRFRTLLFFRYFIEEHRILFLGSYLAGYPFTISRQKIIWPDTRFDIIRQDALWLHVKNL